MDDEERQHLEDLLESYHRRLRLLEKQEALLGPRTPPEILIEIEDTRIRIKQIGSRLRQYTADTSFPESFSTSKSSSLSRPDENLYPAASAVIDNSTQKPLFVDKDGANQTIAYSDIFSINIKALKDRISSYVSEHPIITMMFGALLMLLGSNISSVLLFLSGFLVLFTGLLVVLLHISNSHKDRHHFQWQYLPEIDANQEANLRYGEAIDLIVYLRKGHIQLRYTTSSDLEVIGGRIKQETKAKVEKLKKELLILLQPENNRAAAFIILAWIRSANIDIKLTPADDLCVVHGRLLQETQTEVNRLKFHLLEIIKQEKEAK